MEDHVKKLAVRELLQLHGSILSELKKRNVVRTMNNPVGDYAEWLISSMLGFELQNNSNVGYDAVSPDGLRYQIKARRVTEKNRSRQLGVIRNLEVKPFDRLIALIFREDYSLDCCADIPHDVVTEYATYRPHVNGHVMHLRGKILQDERISFIDQLLRT